MPDKKLTDAEIIKALEDEIHLAEYVDSGFCNGVNLSLVKSTLDLINRLQAENERLNEEKETFKSLLDSSQERYFEISNLCLKYRNKLNTAKAEAYKECIEKVKKLWGMYRGYDFEIKIDNLLKELVGDDK